MPIATESPAHVAADDFSPECAPTTTATPAGAITTSKPEAPRPVDEPNLILFTPTKQTRRGSGGIAQPLVGSSASPTFPANNSLAAGLHLRPHFGDIGDFLSSGVSWDSLFAF